LLGRWFRSKRLVAARQATFRGKIEAFSFAARACGEAHKSFEARLLDDSTYCGLGYIDEQGRNLDIALSNEVKELRTSKPSGFHCDGLYIYIVYFAEMPHVSDVSPFAVRGKLTVNKSATVICVRQRPGKYEDAQNFAEYFRAKYGTKALEHPFLKTYLDGEGMGFMGGWEVLLGQSEVVNWLKSSRDKLVIMRYPGEFKVAGGNVDPGETIEAAAKRELVEEFLRRAETQIPLDSIILRPFSVKQTRPIRSRSNLMYNFVAIADENPWLNSLDLDEVNSALRERREEFLAFLKLPDSPYWNYSRHEKEACSPEVLQLQWVPLPKAMEYCLTSVMENEFVNSWQRKEFKRFNRVHRDPMMMTAAALVELEMFPTVPLLLRYCMSTNFEELAEEEQWLYEGMDNYDVTLTFKKRLGRENRLNPSFKRLHMIQTVRDYMRGTGLSPVLEKITSKL